MKENSHLDKKSLSTILGKPSWRELAKDCVCFANGVGGKILIGIEDKNDAPAPTQKVDIELIEKINKNIPALTLNVGIVPQIVKHENGGEYIELTVLRSKQSIACTTDGKYYMRVSDECKPILPDQIERLAAEKNTFVWEEKEVKKYTLAQADKSKLNTFLTDIQTSERVSPFIKEKTHEEICEHYFLVNPDGYLTNLGVLWLGNRQQRALLHYPPSVQFIKFDENEQKVYKKVWDDFDLNPKEMLNSILNEVPEWNEFIEVSDGIFRKNIYNYPPEAIRELVANAFAHRNYTMQGDIFINLYRDRLEIHSPGLLPLGVTPANILIKSVQRNALLSKLFYDLKLMEKEGSGYDKVYELLLGNGKQIPEVIEGDDRVTVILKKQIVSNKVLKLMDKASKELQLRQKEVIALGLIAQKEGISAIDLSKELNITQPNGLQNWLGRLLELNVVLFKGKTKGTFYYVNPEFLRNADFIEKTNLKRIEPHRLKELIYEDLKNYPGSAISEINLRIGSEINSRTLKTKLDEMLVEEIIRKEGERKGTKYFLST
ncbi:ATP-binding protein [Fluviicola taffensis]|uniref:Putative transcriptional regulator n=1 Tax=Fluviicola taffensis (strain DSM 16823 / NCIMB 13979 / RW262) TaxID=755732 RepID=F2IGS6_FLUTR|nr:ATP-binding protein [Fluviicola taffensis]AEA43693.1 putative transcriptional regulator [Fluviicola taffensis DSM 16823]